MNLNSVYINRTSSFLPNQPVENDDIESIIGLINGKPSKARRVVLKMNGIKQRYYAIDRETGKATHSNAEMAAEAIKNLCDNDFGLSDIECIACGTSSPDQLLPSHGVMVHGELENTKCEVISTSGICASGMQAIKYGYLSVLAGETSNAVCTGSELSSIGMKGIQFESEIQEKVKAMEKRPILAFEKDFLRWMLSDGAGSLLIQNQPNPTGISLKLEWIDIHSFANELPVCMYMGADKTEDHNLIGFRMYSPQELVTDSVLAMKQDVKLLNKHIFPTAIRAYFRTQKKRGFKDEEIDYLLPHISSQYLGDRLNEVYLENGINIPVEKWFTNLATKGNIGSASIFIILDELFRSGKLKKGEKLLLFVPESGRFSMSYALLTVV
jgi:3-oxoacyl-[acyl-carrier-protein] synthase III